MTLVAAPRGRTSWLLIAILVVVALCFIALAAFSTRTDAVTPKPPMHQQR